MFAFAQTAQAQTNPLNIFQNYFVAGDYLVAGWVEGAPDDGKPYLSDNVVKYGVHRAMAKLGIEPAKGVHIGIHCFRHGVTAEPLESGTPIHVFTQLMRHADSNVTLEHYAHIVGDAERVASEKFSQRIGLNITQLESDSELESTSAFKTA